MDIRFFKSSSELEEWLDESHGKAKELRVGFYKKSSAKGGITYPEALDQALCFGWIDGVRKNIDEMSYTIRFTPRKAGSNWSRVNIRRVEELSRLGLMRPSGLEVFEGAQQRNQYSYEERDRKLDSAYEGKLRVHRGAWDFFNAQPPSYQRVANWWVMSAKKEETRLKRLTLLIEFSEKGERLPMLTSPGRRQK